jgi:hypothetical protein
MTTDQKLQYVKEYLCDHTADCTWLLLELDEIWKMAQELEVPASAFLECRTLASASNMLYERVMLLENEE